MKFLEDLTKKQRNAYMSEHGFSFNTKRGPENARITYLFEMNSKEEVQEWFKKTAVTADLSIDPHDHISVYMSNRIYEILNDQPVKWYK